jgi:hypothetical protein
MKNYTAKFRYLIRRQNGNCAIAVAYDGAAAPDSLHHRLHNTKVNRKKYPLLIDSLWNLVAVNMAWHMQHPSFGGMWPREALSREAFLGRHPMIAAALNMEALHGTLDELSPGDLPPYSNSLDDTGDGRNHPYYLLRGRVSSKPAVAPKHKAPSACGNGGRTDGEGGQNKEP